MKKRILYIIIPVAIIVFYCIIQGLNKSVPYDYVEVDKAPIIFPDYTNIIVPINIAPLNFKIENKAKKYRAIFISDDNKQFVVSSKNSKINIPKSKWKKLLKSCNGNYQVDIYINDKGKWTKYKSIKNNVAEESIDKYIAFRHINTGYILWENMGIYQRNIENYKKTPILLNDRTDRNCMNCHTFHKNDPEKMVLHLRAKPSGTLLYNNGDLKFINTGTEYTMSAGVYPSWHPNGNLIAFSVNKINQRFHSSAKRNIYVFDRASDIIVYNINKNEITTHPAISTKRLENLPVWSPDGKYLYFISGPEYYKNMVDTIVKYDLLRIPYNADKNIWGEVDTVLTSKKTGKSISLPEISPDGKFLIFCMADYGYFNVHSPSSDLYIMNLENKKYSKLRVNSNHVESFHSWSSDGKWILFITKRFENLYSRVMFSYIDSTGKASKPFLLPQKDPDYYTHLSLNYNRPVFIKDKVKISANKLSKAAYSNIQNVQFDENVDIDALSGATRIESSIMYERPE
ncbi:hypothetical protein ACFLTE_11150 [Bacteroidota bacterium]